MSTARVDSAFRVIDAPPQVVYQAYMDPDALVRWLPPAGMNGRIERFEVTDKNRSSQTGTA